jgi:GntP family gluconate:H+ symporter
LLGVPPAILGTFVYGRAVNRRLELSMRPVAGVAPDEPVERAEPAKPGELPSFALSITPVLLPVLLITGHSFASTFASGPALAWSGFFGNKNVALLLASFVAAWMLVRQRELSFTELASRLEPAVTSAGVIILITCAGGAFGGMLARIGIDETIGELSGGGRGMMWIVLAWATSSMMKTAQGSGTVAMITASGMMAAVLPDAATLPFHVIYIYAAIGFGSLLLSWMNDSGFWVVCKMSGLTERETFSVWSFVLVVMSVCGVVEILLLSALFPMV